MIFLTTLAIFICLGITQPNYQQRRVYYSESDNACGPRDNINLIINIDD